MSKLIHHTFAPHVTSDYLRATLSLLCSPWTWRSQKRREKLREALRRWFDGECFLFGNGRQGLLALLQSLELHAGDEIIVQGYTCAIVPNAIRAAGLTPIFADIAPDSLNITKSTVELVTSQKTRAIICQHTFGIPADTETLRSYCTQNNIFLIEDCAHSIPDVTGPKHIGKHADFLLLSFGRDKAISGITGGAIISRRTLVHQKLTQYEKSATEYSLFTIMRYLLYPLLYSIARPIYPWKLGKGILWAARKIHLLLPILTVQEKQGIPSSKLQKIPAPSATLATKQLQKLHTINHHRRLLTEQYINAAKKHGWRFPASISKNLPLQKFPLYVHNADTIRESLKKNHIYLDDAWTGATICPRTVDAEAIGYRNHSCPNAENISQEVLSLPTHLCMRREDVPTLIEHLEDELAT